MEYGGAELGLYVVSHHGNARLGEAARPFGVGDNEHRHAVDEGNTGFQRRFGVVARRLLGTHGHEVQEDFHAALPKLCSHVAGFGLGGQKRSIRSIFRHVGRHAVEDGAHQDVHPVVGQVLPDRFGAVGLGKSRHVQGLAHLADINVESRHDLDVLRSIAAQIPVHEAQLFLGIMAVILDALEQGTRAVPHAGDGDANR